MTTGQTYALLRDGGQALLRPYVDSDRQAVRELLEALSPDSRLLRFHSVATHLTDKLVNNVVSGQAVVAEVHGRLAAIARSYPDPDLARRGPRCAVCPRTGNQRRRGCDQRDPAHDDGLFT